MPWHGMERLVSDRGWRQEYGNNSLEGRGVSVCVWEVGQGLMPLTMADENGIHRRIYLLLPNNTLPVVAVDSMAIKTAQKPIA